MSFTIPSIFTAVDKLSAPLRKMTNNMQSFAKKSEVGIARLDRGLRKLTPSLGGVSKQLLAFASTTALIGGLNASINKVKDFEQANANLASVMGTTISQNQVLAKDAERLGSITAKSATEVVGLQEAYARLGFQQQEIVNVTEATINGSIAMNAELAETANLTGAMIRTFDNFSSTDAPQIIDQMTLSTQKSALSFEKLNTSLPIVAGAANAAGINFEQLLALLGKLSDAGIDASSSATALRNIFLESANKGLSFSQILEKIQKNQDKLTAANDAFGKRAAVSASILANNISEISELTQTLESAAAGQENAGVAARTAATQLDTFQGSITLLSSAWEGLLIRTNNNIGALSVLRSVVDFLTQNLESVIGTALTLIGIFATLKAIVLVSRAALLAYNIGLGLTSALSGTAAVAVGANSTALGVYTAVQWLANAALWAFPLTWIIAAIVAVIAAIVAMVVWWEEIVHWVSESNSWIAKLIRFALFPLIILFKLIKLAIGLVVDAFKWLMNWVRTSDSGFAKFIRGTIQKLIDAFETLKSVLSTVGDFFADIWGWIKKMTSSALAPLLKLFGAADTFVKGEVAGLAGDDGEDAQLLNPKAIEQETLTERINSTEKSTLDINIKDEGGKAEVEGDKKPAAGVSVSSTTGF